VIQIDERAIVFIVAVIGLLTVFSYIILPTTSLGMREYESIALQVSRDNNYNYPEYVCNDFSKELVNKLQEKGYFAFRQTVKVPLEKCQQIGLDNCLHSVTVLMLPIDAVDGTILTPEKWKERKYKWFGKTTPCSRCLEAMQ